MLSGCPQQPVPSEQPGVLRSTDGKYTLTVPEGEFLNKITQKEQIAKERLPGTPPQRLTMLYETLAGKKLIYGLTIPLPAGSKLSVDKVVAELKEAAEQSPEVTDVEVELLPAKDGYARFLFADTNSVTGAIGREICLGSLKDEYLLVCVVTTGEKEQLWIRSALQNVSYH